MRVGLLGGSFDPIHNAHLRLAQAAFSQLKLNRVYFVISRSPFKSNRKQAAPRLRLRMVRRALKKKKKFIPVDWEIKRRGPSFTSTTLRWYKKRHPDHELFFIMGSDTHASFSRWKNPAEIRRLAALVIGRRPGAKVKRHVNGGTVVLKGVFPDISSTEMRKRLAHGKSVKAIPGPVLAFIRKKRLYGYGRPV